MKQSFPTLDHDEYPVWLGVVAARCTIHSKTIASAIADAESGADGVSCGMNADGVSTGGLRHSSAKPDVGWLRASGSTSCEVCDELYENHPPDESYAWLTVLCDGVRVKLDRKRGV